MTLYVSVAQHAITPTEDSHVGPGERIDLDPKQAEPWLAAGHLVLVPAPSSPTISNDPPAPAASGAKTAKETQP
jgi:hypothetical protein